MATTNLKEFCDVFRNKICITHPEIAEKYGIVMFLEKVDIVASQTGLLGEKFIDLDKHIVELHNEASRILQALVDNNEQEVMSVLRQYFSQHQ
jgi:hypothetical protein